jgi:hypothetical protein
VTEEGGEEVLTSSIHHREGELLFGCLLSQLALLLGLDLLSLFALLRGEGTDEREDTGGGRRRRMGEVE